jgi:hypothetical protein
VIERLSRCHNAGPAAGSALPPGLLVTAGFGREV